MDIDKMTLRVRKALNKAYNIALINNNQQLELIHLFSSLVNQEDGLIPIIFEKMNINLEYLKKSIEIEINKLPKVHGQNVQVIASRSINEILIEAEKISKDFKDSYISVEHLILCILEKGRLRNY